MSRIDNSRIDQPARHGQPMPRCVSPLNSPALFLVATVISTILGTVPTLGQQLVPPPIGAQPIDASDIFVDGDQFPFAATQDRFVAPQDSFATTQDSFVAPPDGGNEFSRITDDLNFNETRFGGTGESVSLTPFMIGDNFGSGLSQFQGVLRFNRAFTLPGQILATDVNGIVTTIGFELGSFAPADIFTLSPGADGSGDGQVDTFQIAEPTPLSDAPTSPAAGFLFDPNTAQAVYVGNSGGQTPIDGTFADNENWFVSYDYLLTLGDGQNKPAPAPGVATRRVKVSENYYPDVRDRIFSNYSFFNDAFGGLGDVSRFIVGFEKVLVDDLVSFEMRMPYAATYASTQLLEQGARRALEPGNLAVLLKGILIRDTNYVWAGGLGVTVPTAEDSRMQLGGVDLMRVENETVHLLPFTSLLYRVSPDFAVQVLGQLDVAANGDPVRANILGPQNGVLPQIGVYNDATQIGLDIAATKTLYRSTECHQRCALSAALLNMELHYTGTLQPSDFVSSGGITFTSLARNFNILNATAGTQLVMSNGLVITPAMSIPITDGLDKQFDFEALVQVNYLY